MKEKRVIRLFLMLCVLFSILPADAKAEIAAITEVIPLKYDAVGDFNEGLAAVCLNDAWGFIDKTGKEVIPCRYYNDERNIPYFSEGLAAVQGDSGKRDELGNPIYKWGFINSAGNTVVPFEYDEVGHGFKVNGLWQKGFSEGLATVMLYERYTTVRVLTDNYSGTIVTLQYPDTNSGKWGVIDKTGQEIVPCKYDSIESFSEGMAVVRDENEKWGFIDKTGKEVIPCQYDYATNFSEGYALVGIDSGEGVIGFSMKIKKYGVIDKTGQVIMPLKYRNILNGFSEGLAAVGIYATGSSLSNDRWGYVNTDGEEIVSCQYRMVNDFSGGIAAVLDSEWKWGIVDETGQEIVPSILEYTWVREYKEGLAAAAVVDGDSVFDAKWGAIDKNGREVVPCKYEYPNLSEPCFSEGFMAVAVNNAREKPVMERIEPYSWGFVNREGQEIVPLKYNWARNFSEGFAAVNIGADCNGEGGKWGFLQKTSVKSTAYISPQNVLVNGRAVEFQCYALKDTNGNSTNYMKLRDVAHVLNGTAAQFQVGWDGVVNIMSGQAYTPNGSEMTTPFSGDRSYTLATAPTRVNGKEVSIDAIVLTDDKGGVYNYYKLRDLGDALGFRVDWSAEKGIFIETQ